MKQPDFAELLTRYLSHNLPVQRNLSSNTIKSYRDTFKLLLSFCKTEKGFKISKLTIKQLDKKCVEDFLLWLSTSRGVSASTYNQRLSAIHAFFDYVMEEEPAFIEHCISIIKIQGQTNPDKPAQYLTADNLGQILGTPDTSTRQGRRHLTLLTVLYDTAARVSELANVRIRDVRLDAPAVITLNGKGGKIRTVPLMAQTVALLQEYFAENRIDHRIHCDTPLFRNARRKKLTRSGITYIVKKYAAIAQEQTSEIPSKISPHIFRHTKAMHLVQANVHAVYIKDYLGHADLSTTQIYAKADNEIKRLELERASALLDLPKPSNWEQDDGLIEGLSSLGY